MDEREPDAPVVDGESATDPADATQTGAPRVLPELFAAVEPGETVGRYQVVAQIGAGNMGAVYRAYDPELDRDVALKVLHPQARGSGGSATRKRTRLLREAQAMAKLAHPNVIPVFEVGTHRRDVYVAMELVEGYDLKQWLEAELRPWTDVVDVFLQAGRGLLAAHEAGLVHRDFKPANVLVGADGRVRVVDFGVARVGRHAAVAPEGAQASVVAEHLTADGGVLGTPAYIAPEHYDGADADERSDQYSFCVSLWEGVYGERPFTAPQLPELIAKILGGVPAEPPPGRRVPARIRRVVARGLSRVPDRRFDSMAKLLDELRRARFRSRRWAVAGIAIAASAASTAGVLFGAERLGVFARPPAEACKGGAARVEAVWGPRARSEVSQAFSGADGPSGSATQARVVELLDSYGTAWAEMYDDACAATVVRREQPAAIMDRRVSCLDRKLAEMGALVQALARGESDAGASWTELAVDAAHALPPVSACADVGAATEGLEPGDPIVAARVEALRNDLGAAVALRRTGHLADAAELAATVAQQAREAGHAPFLAEALLVHGELLDMLGRSAQGRDLLEQAAEIAADAGDVRVAARSTAALIYVRAVSLGEPQAALASGTAALAMARLAGEDDVEATVVNNLGAASFRAGDNEEAARLFAEAADLRARSLGPDHPRVASSVANLLGALRAQGDLEAAQPVLARLEGIYAAAYHPDHPKIAEVRQHAALLASARGDHEAAVALEKEALAIRERAYGPEHVKVGESMVNIAAFYTATGQFDRAIPFASGAAGVFEKALPPRHPSRVNVLTAWGDALAGAGRHTEAIPLFERALALAEDGDVAPINRANAQLSLALSLDALQRDPERVRTLAKQSIAGYEAAGNLAWVPAAKALLDKP